jgi:phosphatidylglycerophosphatase C
VAQSPAVSTPIPTSIAAASAPRRLVVFDLDGTLTYHDTFVPYVFAFCRRRPWLYLRLPLLVPTVIGYAFRLIDNGGVKAAMIRAMLGGQTREEIRKWNETYVPHVLEHEMRADALAVLAKHREAGDRLILMSASPDLYVPLIGAALGFHETICTGVRWVGDRVHGALTTPNRRDVEKARCLQALRQGHPGLTIVAYGNSTPDLDHLKLADEKLLVNASASARAEAGRLGIPTGEWN